MSEQDRPSSYLSRTNDVPNRLYARLFWRGFDVYASSQLLLQVGASYSCGTLRESLEQGFLERNEFVPVWVIFDRPSGQLRQKFMFSYSAFVVSRLVADSQRRQDEREKKQRGTDISDSPSFLCTKRVTRRALSQSLDSNPILYRDPNKSITTTTRLHFKQERLTQSTQIDSSPPSNPSLPLSDAPGRLEHLAFDSQPFMARIYDSYDSLVLGIIHICSI